MVRSRELIFHLFIYVVAGDQVVVSCHPASWRHINLRRSRNRRCCRSGNSLRRTRGRGWHWRDDRSDNRSSTSSCNSRSLVQHRASSSSRGRPGCCVRPATQICLSIDSSLQTLIDPCFCLSVSTTRLGLLFGGDVFCDGIPVVNTLA